MEYKISDDVWHRVVQVIQEAMLMGIDCADLLRQIRLTTDPNSEGHLCLSPSYVKQVAEMHEKYLSELEKKRSQENSSSQFHIISS